MHVYHDVDSIFVAELGSVLHKCHVQCNEMVYFIQQLQYYVNFEVSSTDMY